MTQHPATQRYDQALRALEQHRPLSSSEVDAEQAEHLVVARRRHRQVVLLFIAVLVGVAVGWFFADDQAIAAATAGVVVIGGCVLLAEMPSLTERVKQIGSERGLDVLSARDTERLAAAVAAVPAAATQVASWFAGEEGRDAPLLRQRDRRAIERFLNASRELSRQRRAIESLASARTRRSRGAAPGAAGLPVAM